MQELKSKTIEKLKEEVTKDEIDYQVLDALTRLLDQVKWQMT